MSGRQQGAAEKMKHRYKTEKTSRDGADSEEDEQELRGRRGSSDPTSQEEPGGDEHTDDMSDTDVFNWRPQIPPRLLSPSLRRIPPSCSDPKSQEEPGGDEHTDDMSGAIKSDFQQLFIPPPLPPSVGGSPPSPSAAAPPFGHQSSQETSSQSSVTEAGGLSTVQGIKPSSLFDMHTASTQGSCFGTSLSKYFPRTWYEGRPSFSYSSLFSFGGFQGQTDQGSVQITGVSDLQPDEDLQLSDEDSVASDEPLRERAESPVSSDVLHLLPPLPNSSTPSALSDPIDFSSVWPSAQLQPVEPLRKRMKSCSWPQQFPMPPAWLEGSQTKVEHSSTSSAEAAEGLKHLTKCLPEALGSSEPQTHGYCGIFHSDPCIPVPDSCPQSSIPPPTDEEKLEEESSGGFLWGAEPFITEQVPAPSRAPSSLPPSPPLRAPSCLARSLSAPSLSRAPQSSFRRAASLPDMKVQQFTPAVGADGDDDTYRFRCPRPGLYRCSVSGLLFGMKGGGAVLYRTVPWSRRLLGQHHKKPAGPLFDIKCPQQTVCQLHLPHCDIISPGGARSLQVAHVTDESVEFIEPDQVTQTHVVLNISGFSAYGNVKDEDSPPEPVRALVLLFYKPPQDPDLRSVLSVLLLPRNVVFHKMRRDRRKSDKNERYIETSSCCSLQPKQVYSLSTSPEDDLIKVQPKEAEFDDEHHESYFPSFQVVLKRVLTDVKLTLKHSSSSSCVWEREVCLLPPTVRTVDPGPERRASDVRSCFIRSISAPVLSSLLDHLLEKRVITGAEREAADAKQSRSDRARSVFDTVSKKGEAASSEMVEFLYEEDPFLCEHLGLKQRGEAS